MEFHATGILAFAIFLFTLIGVVTTLFLLFTYFILNSNRKERRKNGVDYHNGNNNDSINNLPISTDN